MKFQYVAVDADGKKVKSVVEAENEAGAIYYIRNQELTPISVKPYKEKAKNFWEIEIMEPEVHKLKMKKKDLAHFADKMAIMMKAGVKLSMAMEVMIESEKNRRYQKIYRQVLTDLYAGMSLADSMRGFVAFPEAVVNMVASGEKNGKLDWAFARICEMYEKELALSGKVSSAFTYPAFLVVLMIALFVVMTTVVLPKFSSMYDSFGGELPAMTKFLMNVSDFLIHYGWIVLLALIVIVAAVLLLYRYNRTFQDKVSGLAMKIPALGRLSMVSNTSAFARITTALLQSGVDVVESVRIGASVIKNKHMRHSLEKSLEQVALGASLHSAFQKLGIFESLFVSMVQIGEEASMLPDTFQKMADMYEAESNEASRKFTSVLEPILTMSIGLIIALMVVAIIMPMFNMYSVILG